MIVNRVHCTFAMLVLGGCGNLLGLGEFEDRPGSAGAGGNAAGSGGVSDSGIDGSAGSAGSNGGGGQPADAGPDGSAGAVGCTGPVVDLFTSTSLSADALDAPRLVVFSVPGGGAHVAVSYSKGNNWSLAIRSVDAAGKASPVKTRDAGAAFRIVEGISAASDFEFFAIRDDNILTFAGTSNSSGVATLGAAKETPAPDGQPGGGGPPAGCEKIDLVDFALTLPSDTNDQVAVTCDGSLFSGRIGLNGSWHFSSIPPGTDVRGYVANLPGHIVAAGTDYYYKPNSSGSFQLGDRGRIDLSAGVPGETLPLVLTRVGADKVLAVAGFKADAGDEQVWSTADAPDKIVDALDPFTGSKGNFTKLAKLTAIPTPAVPSYDGDSALFAASTTKGGLTVRLYRFDNAGKLSHDLDVFVPPTTVQLDAWSAAHLGADAAYVAWTIQESGAAVVRGCPVSLK